mgnify:CR=1 FL=1
MEDLHFDFEAALLVFTLLTGVIWLVDRFWLSARRAALAEGQEGEAPPPNGVIEFARSFFPVVLAVLFLRSFVVEPFRIPSGSMLPTLLAGDFILVNKFSYGIRLPVFHTKVFALDEPERGDVIVFRFPPDPSKDFIKRVVGLPGDEIVYADKNLYVNGERVNMEPLGLYDEPRVPELRGALHYLENLPGAEHAVLLQPRRPSRDASLVVPEGRYFVMGDNRDGSDDSRRWGFVPEQNLVGRAFLVWMSWDANRNLPAWQRIGTGIE